MFEIEEIGIGMMTAEIGQRRRVHDGALRRPQAVFQNLYGIRPGDSRHRIKAHAESGQEQICDPVKINERLHQGLVITHAIDDRHFHIAKLTRTEPIKIDIGGLDNLERLNGSGARKNRRRHLFPAPGHRFRH
jgi:hypothetical protein